MSCGFFFFPRQQSFPFSAISITIDSKQAPQERA